MTTPFNNIKEMVDQIGYMGLSDCSDAEFRNEATLGIEAIRKSLEEFMRNETRVFAIAGTDGNLIEDTILWSDVLSTELSSKEADLAAALARAQAAEGEAARLQNKIHLYKDAANLAGMQYGLERENSRLLYSTLSKAAPSALADIKSKLNYSNTEGDKVLGEYTRRVQDMSIALKPFADRFNSWQKHSEGKENYRLKDEFDDDINWGVVEHVYGHAHYIYHKYLK